MQTVSDRIYEAFFAQLANNRLVRPETVEALRAIYHQQRLADKQSLARIVQDMENRHAQNQNTDH